MNSQQSETLYAECPICLEDGITDYITFDCGHSLCMECAGNHFYNDPRCPLCRRSPIQMKYGRIPAWIHMDTVYFPDMDDTDEADDWSVIPEEEEDENTERVRMLRETLELDTMVMEPETELHYINEDIAHQLCPILYADPLETPHLLEWFDIQFRLYTQIFGPYVKYDGNEQCIKFFIYKQMQRLVDTGMITFGNQSIDWPENNEQHQYYYFASLCDNYLPWQIDYSHVDDSLADEEWREDMGYDIIDSDTTDSEEA